MKRLFKYMLVGILCVSAIALANPEKHQHNNQKAAQINNNEAACENSIDVKVNGLVCDFCARALEKVFGRRDDVRDIDVDLSIGKVSIALKETKTMTDKTIKKLITDSGYNVVAIKKGCKA